MTSSEDRWTYPAEGADPRDRDDERVHADEVEQRQVSHDQDVERDQGLSSDKPGVDVSEREVAAGRQTDERETGGTSTE